MRLSSSFAALATITTIYGPFTEAAMKFLDDMDQVIKYSGAWNFRTESGAMNGGYSLSKDPNAALSVVYTFKSVEFYSPLWPAEIKVIISVGSRAIIVDLQDHDVPAVPLPTDVPPRSTKPSRVVWTFQSPTQQEFTINVRAASGGVSPAYCVVDLFGFEIDDPPSTSSSPVNTVNPPLPSPTTPPTTEPTSTPSPSQSSSSLTSSESTRSSTAGSSSLTVSGSTTQSFSGTNVISNTDSSTLPLSFQPTSQPTVIQGNGNSAAASGSTRSKQNTGLIAGLSVGACVLVAFLAGAMWLMRRRRQSGTESETDNSGRANPFTSPEEVESASGQGRIGMEGVGIHNRVEGKRNLVMDAGGPFDSPLDGQGPSPGTRVMNEKSNLLITYHGTHNNDPTPTTPGSSRSPLHSTPVHQSGSVASGASSAHPVDLPLQDIAPTFRSSVPTNRLYPPSMMDTPPTYTAADPTSVLWMQRIEMAAGAAPAIPQSVAARVPPVGKENANGSSNTEMQMDPELD